MPAATAAALPPDEPPGVRAGSQGFRVRSVTGRIPHSGIAVVPTTIAPAARSRRTTLWSCVARTSRMSEEPCDRQRAPRVSSLLQAFRSLLIEGWNLGELALGFGIAVAILLLGMYAARPP